MNDLPSWFWNAVAETVPELSEKFAEFGLSTQGNKETPRERWVNLLDADGNKDDYFIIENSPNENKMANLIDSPTQVSLPVQSFASGTDGSLASNSQDVEAFADTG